MWCVCRADGWVGGWIAEMEDGVGCGGMVWGLGTWGVGELGGLWSLWRVIGGWGVGESVAWCMRGDKTPLRDGQRQRGAGT